MVPAHLAGAEGGDTLRIVRRLLEPNVIAPVVAEIGAATGRQAGGGGCDAAVIVLLQHAGVPQANLIGLPIRRTREAAARSLWILELDYVAGKIGRETPQCVIEEVG